MHAGAAETKESPWMPHPIHWALRRRYNPLRVAMRHYALSRRADDTSVPAHG